MENSFLVKADTNITVVEISSSMEHACGKFTGIEVSSDGKITNIVLEDNGKIRLFPRHLYRIEINNG